jgi:YD repeat-containing protein
MKQRLIYTLAILFVSIQSFAQSSTTYTYDNLNRLTKVTYSNGITVSYTYDALGNRTSKNVTGNTATTYTVTTNVSPTGAGTVTGGGTYSSGTSIELNAIANSGYKFSHWSDGDTSNPRSMTVTKNITLTALFEADESQPPFEVTDISKLNNVIYINPVEASAGSDVTLSVNMKNSVPMEGFSFDLYLPEGMEFLTDEDGFPEAYLSTKRTTARKTNTFEAAIQSDGALRMFAASTNGSTINGNDGEVVTVKIHIGASVAKGLYPLTLRQSALSDSNARSYDTAEVIGSIQVGTTLTCDVNQDGAVDISDVVAVINTMAGDNKFRATADVNGDDSIDISDVVAIINYMAGNK